MSSVSSVPAVDADRRRTAGAIALSGLVGALAMALGGIHGRALDVGVSVSAIVLFGGFLAYAVLSTLHGVPTAQQQSAVVCLVLLAVGLVLGGPVGDRLGPAGGLVAAVLLLGVAAALAAAGLRDPR